MDTNRTPRGRTYRTLVQCGEVTDLADDPVYGARALCTCGWEGQHHQYTDEPTKERALTEALGDANTHSVERHGKE